MLTSVGHSTPVMYIDIVLLAFTIHLFQVLCLQEKSRVTTHTILNGLDKSRSTITVLSAGYL